MSAKAKEIKEKPIHEHDCDVCKFLGNHTEYGKKGDLYICIPDDGRSWTPIFRTGENGDYSTRSVEAVRRAVARGLIPKEDAIQKDGSYAGWVSETKKYEDKVEAQWEKEFNELTRYKKIR